MFSRIKKFWWLGLVIFLVGLTGYCVFEAFWIKVENITYRKDVPAAFSGYKIVYLSDIHYGPFFSDERLAEMVERVNGLRPDLILLGGDYIFDKTDQIEPVFQGLSQLKAKDGVFAVLGNHDHWEDPDVSWKCMREAGIVALDNKATWIVRGGEKIRLGGVGDWWNDKVDFEPTIAGTTKGDLVILLSHNPDVAELEDSGLVDLILSGHTHAGQLTLFGQWGVIPSFYGQKYRQSWAKAQETDVYVSRGVGNTFLPLRFWARPEITVLTLEN
ncbi:MAG: metallophosphoesterase [Patescibacteria group bacterium]